jgi:hypothetical protein
VQSFSAFGLAIFLDEFALGGVTAQAKIKKRATAMRPPVDYVSRGAT